MTLISSVLNWLMKKRIHQIELFKKYPNEVQEELLKKLVNSSRNTIWGKEYDYKSIKTLNEFKERIPISTYEDLKPYIDRLRKGEENVLWEGELVGFAKSSGTTAGKSKFIPVSYDSLEDCHYKGGKDMLSIYFNLLPDSKLFEGKNLVMGGSGNIQEVSNSSYYEGDLSAILMNNLPYWAQFMRTPSLSIALMNEWENKLELMVESTYDHDVTGISGVPSWMLVLLRKVIEKSGKNSIDEIWPNLEVFFHGGVNFDPYVQQFKSLIKSDKMHYFNTYNASEGFFGIQDQLESDDILLMLDYGVYYEFVPVSDNIYENSKALSLSEVELGVNYAIIITTNAGLWRYQIGDTVSFTCLSPYRIRITGRTKNFINVVGEELIIDNAEKAFSIACEKTSSVITEYTASPHFDGDSIAHQWLVEFDRQPENIEYFIDAFDNALKSLNSDYEAKRYHNMVLKEPIVSVMPEKTFYNWMKKREKLGGQNKVPRLSNNRKYVDELLEMV
jgi:hypothetical protein